MKDVSTTYAGETAEVRKPLELYRIWCGSTYWIINEHVSVVFGGKEILLAILIGLIVRNSIRV